MSHVDIRQRAVDLLRKHGDAAFLKAAMNADAALIDGDQEQHRLWLRITKFIGEIEEQGIGSGMQ